MGRVKGNLEKVIQSAIREGRRWGERCQEIHPEFGQRCARKRGHVAPHYITILQNGGPCWWSSVRQTGQGINE